MSKLPPAVTVQCSVPKLSEVLQRVEGDQLAAACKILAVAITDRDSYALERRDDVEVKMRSRDTNKVNPGSNYCLFPYSPYKSLPYL